ncbi:DegT/DnrJ/EryC1/StrS family aminotransferase [Paenibacillus nasutitermitis]|uniref:Spore coat polysaccharide biosynthesis protein SpsC n=1 Tax=Paenibacillus nasutitermitis TaxID=1652958 RepID=A0A916YK06_9BACL|nr:DegT/DnrJ/EryC1/StrS family aminotransferase [Paenibacillus nasutitermitis]GGD47329.1 spore coat polysaccharide biosynthesis protein SpsC [Paenibacillus nasutitermitis]
MDEVKLAIHGGSKVKTTPFGTGKRFGLEEAKELLEALEQNTLFYHFGGKVKRFLGDFNDIYGVKHSVATSSGTAAIHVALGVAGIAVGDEVITSPITDQGTLVGILYQNAIPVFADLDPHTYNLDPKSVEARITPRTKAILVVHLAGNPCDMDAIMAIADKYGLKVIEDCAQSYLSRYKGRLVGTIGDYGCFSTNDFKHISTGDGGIVTINSGSEEDYFRTHAFADKNYQRFGTSVVRDLSFLAPNYRMTELQGAVGIAQLKKLQWICDKRRAYGDRLTAGICDLPGIHPHQVTAGSESSYWFYMLRVDETQLSCTRDEFAEALSAEGISCGAGYISQPVYMQPMFQKKQAYKGSHFPFDLSDCSYDEGLCPNAEEILKSGVRLPVNEFFTEDDVEDMIQGIRKVALYYGASQRAN